MCNGLRKITDVSGHIMFVQRPKYKWWLKNCKCTALTWLKLRLESEIMGLKLT